jgi:hypothetical protein
VRRKEAELQCPDVRAGNSTEYFAARVLANGAIDSTWSPSEGQLCFGSQGGLLRTTVREESGGGFVGWVDGRRGEPDIYLQRLTPTGSISEGWPVGGIPVCQADRSQNQVDIAPDETGGVFISWQDYREGHGGRVYVQRISPEGQPASGWPAGGRPANGGTSEQSSPHMAPDGDGGAYLTWCERASRRLLLHLTRVSAQGGAVAGWPTSGALITDSLHTVQFSAIVSDSLGNAAVVWQQVDTLGTKSMQAIRVSATMSPATNWILAPRVLVPSASDIATPALSRIGSDGVLVVSGERQPEGSLLRAQRLSLTGAESSPWPPNGCILWSGSVGHAAPSVLPDSSGGAFVAWEGYAGAASDIYLQRISSTGSIVAGWDTAGVPVVASRGTQYAPALQSDGAGGVIVSWVDPTRVATAASLLAARLGGISLQLIEAKATPGRARIRWRLQGTTGDSLDVERHVIEGEWSRIARVAPDSGGVVSVDDGKAPEGVSLEYRLVMTLEGERIHLAATKVSIPRRPTVLAIHWARSDPARNAVVLFLAVPSAERIDFQLHDVTGRRMASEGVTGFEPGDQEVTFTLPGHIPSGIYFIRVVQAGRSRTTKVALVR